MPSHYNAETNPTQFQADRAWLRYHGSLVRKESEKGVPTRLPELFTPALEEWVVEGLSTGASIDLMAMHKSIAGDALADLRAATTEVQKQAATIEKLQEDIAVLGEQRLADDKRSAAHWQRNQDLQIKLVDAEDRIAQLQNRLGRERAEAKARFEQVVKQGVTDAQATANYWRGECDKLRDELAEARANIASSSARAVKFGVELHNAREELRAMRDAAVKKASLRTPPQQKLDADAALERLRDFTEEQKVRIRDHQGDVCEVDAERAALQKELAHWQAKASSFEERFHKEVVAHTKMTAQWRELQSQKEATEREHQTWVSELNSRIETALSRAQRAERILKEIEDKPTDAARLHAVRKLANDAWYNGRTVSADDLWKALHGLLEL